MSIPAQSKLKYILLCVIFGLASASFLRTTLEIMHSSKRLDDMRNDVQSLENQKEKLEQSISYKKTDEFIEEQARNELNLIKPNEKVYIAPKVLGEKDNRLGLPETNVVTSNMNTDLETNNAELWLKVFF